jgi:hypothetical protein
MMGLGSRRDLFLSKQTENGMLPCICVAYVYIHALWLRVYGPVRKKVLALIRESKIKLN